MDLEFQRYRKRPLEIDAVQWFVHGDREGKIVRYYRHPLVEGDKRCGYCGEIMHNHGWIDTLEGGHVVCPGDWIIRGIAGEYYPCKPDIFNKTNEKIQ